MAKATAGYRADIYAPNFIARRGGDATNGGVSSTADHITIVGTTHMSTGTVCPVPGKFQATEPGNNAPAVAIRFMRGLHGALSAHLVPVAWDERRGCYSVFGRAYSFGGNRADLDREFARAIQFATTAEVPEFIKIHDRME